jgi:hypothetical protein
MMQRADALLRQMTLEEKAMQLSAVMPFALLGPEGPTQSQLDAQLKHGIGHISELSLFGYKTPAAVAKTVNAIQRYLVTETRLKIPAIFHTIMVSDGNADQTDALHNHTLGKFLVTFGDVQTTDEVLAKWGCAEKTPSRTPPSARLAAQR